MFCVLSEPCVVCNLGMVLFLCSWTLWKQISYTEPIIKGDNKKLIQDKGGEHISTVTL